MLVESTMSSSKYSGFPDEDHYLATYTPPAPRRQRDSIKRTIKRFLPDWALLIRKHWKAHGRPPRVFRPTTFNDKILHRILFDRRPLWTQFADKAAVRSYVEARLGSDILPKVYCLTTQPESIPFAELPDRFVVKPTHGSGWVKIVTDKSTFDQAELVETCRAWLRQSYYWHTLEWAYKGIKPQMIVEEFIDDGSGAAPPDYKLFVFHGRVEMIQVDTDRFSGHRRRLFTRDWQKLDVDFVYPAACGDIPRPPHLAEMIAAAERLGGGLDFIRADFYDIGPRIYFGELTVYPEGGRGRFSQLAFDRLLGDIWTTGDGTALAAWTTSVTAQARAASTTAA